MAFDQAAQDQLTFAVRDLMNHIPLNDLDLPTGIYRPDLLPFHDYQAPITKAPLTLSRVEAVAEPKTIQLFADVTEEGRYTNEIVPSGSVVVTEKPPEERVAGFRAEDLDPAFEWLNYDEGFPAQRAGLPFWSKLPYEPQAAYQTFERYLTMGAHARDGNRSISALVQLHTNKQSSEEETSALLSEIQHMYVLYYWKFRTAAYDMFRVAEHRRQMELRAVEVNNDHFFRAQKLMRRLDTYLEDEELFWEEITPKTALELFRHLTSVQRLSAGMPAMSPAADGSGTGNVKSIEFYARQRAAEEREDRTQETGADGLVIDGSTGLVERALADPETAGAAQSLIIKLQLGTH